MFIYYISPLRLFYEITYHSTKFFNLLPLYGVHHISYTSSSAPILFSVLYTFQETCSNFCGYMLLKNNDDRLLYKELSFATGTLDLG